MLSLSEAKRAVNEWNAVHTDAAHVSMETVEECVTAFLNWQEGIRTFLPLPMLSEHLDRHWSFCRRLPDELLCEIFEIEESVP